jgi:endonuclease/exonuclease/phosphatase family metal-dependent hydrolase
LTTRVSTFDVRVMTYNVLEADTAGRHEGDGVVQPWSVREPAVVRTITTAHPDVIGIQEAAAFVGSGQERQIDSLHHALPGYGLAFTEALPGTPGWHRTGNYILFNQSTFAKVGDGGHWALGDMRWAAWQVLKNKATGAKFLFVNAHLLPTSGGAADTKRRHETQALLSDARSQAASAGGVPIVYVGDFNSDQYRKHRVNAPLLVMQNSLIADAYQAAQKHVRAQWNTANGYRRRPPHDGAHIDAVFAPAGVGVRSWELQLRLSHGKFVGVIPSDHNALVSDLTIPYS